VLLKNTKDPDEQIRQDPASWPGMVNNAIPVMEHIFEDASMKFDLSTASGKTNFAAWLLPMIGGMRDEIRRDHYVNKVAQLTGSRYQSVESALFRFLSNRSEKVTGPRVDTGFRSAFNETAQEEYFLWLLLRHPELLIQSTDLEAECFLNAANREIFQMFIETGSLHDIQNNLRDEQVGRLESLLQRDYSTDGLEKDSADYRLKYRQALQRDSNLEERFMKVKARLRENYYKREIGLVNAALETLNDESDQGFLEVRLLELTERLRDIQVPYKTG
jgi:DNA primase